MPQSTTLGLHPVIHVPKGSQPVPKGSRQIRWRMLLLSAAERMRYNARKQRKQTHNNNISNNISSTQQAIV